MPAPLIANRRESRVVDELAGLRHVIFYYWTPETLTDVVAGFLERGLRDGRPVLLVGEERHRDACFGGLALRGMDLRALEAAGQARFLAQRQFYAEGRIDLSTLRRVVDEGRKDTAARGTRRTVVVGCSAGALCAQGDRAACLEREAFWQGFARLPDARVLCPYDMEDFGGEIDRIWLGRLMGSTTAS